LQVEFQELGCNDICISVDDPTWSDNNWFTGNYPITFSADCGN